MLQCLRSSQALHLWGEEKNEIGDQLMRRRWARQWLEETGVCSLCGKSGPDHECICLEDK